MEAILSKLMMPDTTEIAEGTRQLKEAFKNPQVIPELCSIMTSSESAQIRQYCALLLRKKFGHSRAWLKLTSDDRTVLKNGCLDALVREPEKSVKLAIAQLVGVIAKHEMKPEHGWKELQEFLQHQLNSQDVGSRTLGMYTLSVLSDSTGESAKRYLVMFVKNFEHSLQNDVMEVGFYAVKTLTNLVHAIGSDEMPIFQRVIGHALQFIPKLVEYDEEKARESLEIFDELFESEVAIVVPHIKSIVELGIKISSDNNLDDSLRVKGITFLGRLSKLKKKTIVKHKLYATLISTLFTIMCNIENEDEDEEDMAEGSSPHLAACQALDVLALNMPPDKFMPCVLSHVQPAIESNDPAKMKGAFTALAISAEGCSEYIRTNKHLKTFLQIIGRGIKNDHLAVQNSSLYALGQYSEYLQPEISEYANEIIPILLQCLDKCKYQKDAVNVSKSGLDRIFFALDVFCENMGKKLSPFLPDLMTRLLSMLEDTYPVETKELSISGIGAAGNAVKEEIIPYFEEIMNHLKKYLSVESVEQSQTLLLQSMDTLGILAKAVGRSNFAAARELAENSYTLGLNLVNNTDDPDIRKCAYSLFASVAFVVQEDFGVVLPQIVEYLIKSCQSTDGVSVELKDADQETALPLNDLSDEDEEAEDEISLGTNDSQIDMDRLKVVSVENSFVDEKEQALLAMKEICEHARKSFFPYLHRCLEEAWKLLDYPAADVRKAAIESVVEFAITYHIEGSSVSMEAFSKLCVNIVQKFLDIVKDDEEVHVVCTCLEELAHLLKECKSSVTSISGHPEMIVQCIHHVMKSECKCMDSDNVDGGLGGEDDDELEAEQDELLFEYAGEVLPALGNAMKPNSFSPYFAGLLPQIMRKTKKQSSVSERSFGAGALAECMEPLQGVLEPYIETLLPTFIRLSKDEDDDVRNNAIYGLGELALHGHASIHPHFHQILQLLSSVLPHEENPRVIDQIVGAVCRMIVAKPESVPIQEVLPVVFKNLPLKEDPDEYAIVFRCLLVLHTGGYNAISQHIKDILELAGSITLDDDCNRKKIEESVSLFLKTLREDMPQDFEHSLMQLSQEAGSKVMAFLNPI